MKIWNLILENKKMEIEKNKLNEELEQKRKLFVRNWIISIITLLTYLSSLFYFLNQTILSVIFLISIITISYVYYVISKFKFDFKALTDIGFAFFTFLIYVNTLLFWKSYPIIYLFFLLVPIAVYIINGFKSMIKWTIIISLLLLSTPFISTFLNIYIPLNFSTTESIIVNFSIIMWSVYLLIFFLYFHSEFEKIKRKINPFDTNLQDTENFDAPIITNESTSIANDITTNEEISSNLIENKNLCDSEDFEKEEIIFNEKFDELYNEIEKYFEEKQPYQNPEFNIHKLVIDLKTNSRYVFNAFHQKNGSNFKTYLNNYRIKEVKKKLDNKEHELYTLKHIYNSVGFTNQSTFNRIFKEVEEITPSEYIAQLK